MQSLWSSVMLDWTGAGVMSGAQESVCMLEDGAVVTRYGYCRSVRRPEYFRQSMWTEPARTYIIEAR